VRNLINKDKSKLNASLTNLSKFIVDKLNEINAGKLDKNGSMYDEL
jgi:hypothetical protein